MVKGLIRHIEENRSRLAEEWIEMYGSGRNGRPGKDVVERLTGYAYRAVDAFCGLIERDDFTKMEAFLDRRFEKPGTEILSIADGQMVLASARNVLLTDLARKYSGEDLVTVLSLVNQAFDRIIFHMCGYFQKHQEERCRAYAKQLERQVKERSRELEESQSNYQILFEKINDGCFVNQNGRIVFANKAFCQMHAYERDEIIGMQCQALISDDSRDMVMKRFYQHLKGKNRFDTFIYCRQDKNGRRIPTENRIKLIKYKGRPAVLGLSTDITRRIEMEEKIKQKDRLALIGRLTTSIAHEIRNPLSAIKVNIQILLEKLELEGNDLRRLQIAQEQSVLLENILSETLQFAKPIQLDYSLTDLGKVIDQATEFFEASIRNASIEVRREIDPDVDYVMIDRERVIEAVANVFKNAIEAFDEDGPADKRIEITASSMMLEEKRYIRLSVLDNGKGIAEDDRKNMFEPFVTKGKKGGVGLGLPIVKRIVDAHNGYFDIESTPGQGTRFSFIIPAEITQ